MSDYSIVVKDLRKRYRIGKGIPTLRDLFSRGKQRGPSYHWAVDGVNFKLQPGEALGIIGPNGAGKTTILKLLSRVTQPTSGELRVNGRFSALIELGAGFHPDLTGRENVYLNGAILGMKRAEINARFDEIIAFAGIGDYLDTPVKRYSSGMNARLGFAIAAYIDPEVLLVDEVLAVGDHAFQMKCYARMDELRAKGTSLIFVSHNMEVVRRVCDRGMVMYRGKPIFHGSSADAVIAYSDAVRQAARATQDDVPKEEGLSQRTMTFDAEIEAVQILNGDGAPVHHLRGGQRARVAIDVKFDKPVREPIFALTIRTPDGQVVYDTTTRWMKVQTPRFAAGERCRVFFDIDVNLVDGSYDLGADVAATDLSHYYDRLERAMSFWVKGRDGAQGIADLDARITFEALDPLSVDAA